MHILITIIDYYSLMLPWLPKSTTLQLGKYEDAEKPQNQAVVVVMMKIGYHLLMTENTSQ